MSLKDTLQELSGEVTDFVAATLVHRPDGIAVDTFRPDDADASVDVAASDAYLAEMLSQHFDAEENLGRSHVTEDISVQTAGGLLIARPFPDSDFFWTLVAGPGANITLTRAIMRNYHEPVAELVPGD